MVVDLDPQAMQVPVSPLILVEESRTYEVLTKKVDIVDAIKSTEVNGLGVVPSGFSQQTQNMKFRVDVEKEFILKKAIDKLPKQYSAIIVDCPPGLGFLTTNALAASDKVLIPLQCEFYALEGLSQILRVIKTVKSELNSSLDLDGILLYDV